MRPAKRDFQEPTDLKNESSLSTHDPLLTQTEAATLLHVEPRTLESWRQHRVGPAFIRYSRRCVRYRVADIQAWLTEQKVQTRQDPSTNRYA